MQCFFSDMAEILRESGTFGAFFRQKWEAAGTEPTTGPKASQIHLADIVSDAFPNSKIVPKGKNSANKRIHMFLRWMVRQDSPVDLGCWKWYSPARLFVPLDVHVMQEAVTLGLLPENAPASRKTAAILTTLMEEVFPGDPARGDFALFGLGISSEFLPDGAIRTQFRTNASY